MWDLNCTTSVIQAPSTGVFRPKFYKNEKVWRHEKQILLVLRLFKVLRMSSDKRYFHMSQTCKNDPRPPSRSKGYRLVIFWYFDKRNLPLHIYVCRKLSQRLKIFCPRGWVASLPDMKSNLYVSEWLFLTVTQIWSIKVSIAYFSTKHRMREW